MIVLPSGLSTTLGQAELRDVLVHECAHIVRRDQIVIVLQAVAYVAYWPIWPVHWLNRLLANAREEVCDNYVLARQQPVTYGETLCTWPPCRGISPRSTRPRRSSAGAAGWRIASAN